MNLEKTVKLFIVLACIPVFIVIIALNAPTAGGKALIALAFLAVVILWAIVTFFFERKRKRELESALTRRGLEIGTPQDARFIHELRAGQRSLTGKFWAHGHDASGPLNFAEFVYYTGSGKHTRTHRHTQASRPVPASWPSLRLSRRPRFLHRPIADLINPSESSLENPAFSQRWTLTCRDRDFALLLLTPPLQDWLVTSPKDESWTISEGQFALTRERKCSAAEVEVMIARLDEFLGMIPPELMAYEQHAHAPPTH